MISTMLCPSEETTQWGALPKAHQMSHLRSYFLAGVSHLAVRHFWIEQARAERTAISGQPQRDQSAGETERRAAAQAGKALAAAAAARGAE
jgi:hypothetical protein